jgi:hypothetical protein
MTRSQVGEDEEVLPVEDALIGASFDTHAQVDVRQFGGCCGKLGNEAGRPLVMPESTRATLVSHDLSSG